MSGEDDSIAKVPLTDKEKDQFVIAMTLCAKGSLPSVDFDKFEKYAGFNTKKTAQNTWSKIKGKLPAVEEGEDGEEGSSTKKKQTPKKQTPKKRTKKSEETVEDEDGSDVEATPSKKAKKSLKKVVAAADPEAAPEEEGEAEEE